MASSGKVSNQTAFPTSSLIDDEEEISQSNLRTNKFSQENFSKQNRLLRRPTRGNNKPNNYNQPKDEPSDMFAESISQSPLMTPNINNKPKQRNDMEFAARTSGRGFGLEGQERSEIGSRFHGGMTGDSGRPPHPPKRENNVMPNYERKPPRPQPQPQASFPSRTTELKKPTVYSDRVHPSSAAPNSRPIPTDRYQPPPSVQQQQHILSKPQPQQQPTSRNPYPPRNIQPQQPQSQPYRAPISARTSSQHAPTAASTGPISGAATTSGPVPNPNPNTNFPTSRPLYDRHAPGATQLPSYQMGATKPLHYPTNIAHGYNANQDDEPKFREMPKPVQYTAQQPQRRRAQSPQYNNLEMYGNRGNSSSIGGSVNHSVYPTQLPGLFWYFVRDIVMWKNFMISAAVFMIGLSCLLLSMMLEIPLFAVITIAVFIHIVFSVIITILRFIYYRVIKASPKAFEESQNDIMSSSVIFKPESIENFASAFARSFNHAIFTYQRATLLRPVSFTIFAFFICGFVLFLSFTMDVTTAGLIVFTGLFTIPKSLSLLLMPNRSHSRYVSNRRRETRRRRH